MEVLSEIDEVELARAIAAGAALGDGHRSSCSCAMASGAAVVVRWPPEQSSSCTMAARAADLQEIYRRSW